MKTIPYGRQDISREDIDAVIEVLESDFITQGPAIPSFENALESYCEVNHAVAVNSATSALHIACLALGLRKGDVMWTSPISFVASANVGLYCGAAVDFVDIDFETNNMSIGALTDKLFAARKSNTLPKIIIPVHMAGYSCDMDSIQQLSREFGFKIIEDASHGIGGKFKGQPVGSCKYSDITVFSFHPVKIITTGEGGAALTNDETLAKKMQMLRSHGVTRDTSLMSSNENGEWYYEQLGLGFNYRMTDIQAALGSSQLVRLDEFVETRNKLASKYDAGLSNLAVKTPVRNPAIYSSYHLYIVKLLNSNGVKRKAIFEFLRAKSIGVNVHYIPVHLQPFYREFGFAEGNFPVAEESYQVALSLPLYPGLTEEDQAYVIRVLDDAIRCSGP